MSWVATASCKMVESRARRSLDANTPDSVTTLAHRVEDPPRLVAGTQAGPPQGQHRRVEPPIAQRQTSRCFPSYITTQPLYRFPVREALQRLENHHHSDHRPRYRRAAPRAEQIGDHLIRKQTAEVLSQEPVHRTHRNQMPQIRCVQKLKIKTFTTLHTTTIIPQHLTHEPITPDKVT